MSQVDRELLELAAKAAGIEFIKYTDEWNGGGLITEWIEGQGGGYHSLDAKVWNPLTDDGDEARLEAALMLHVEWHPGLREVRVGTAEIFATEPFVSDKQAARRRAGVRAAAEIGKDKGER
jgi:hypothetical protein